MKRDKELWKCMLIRSLTDKRFKEAGEMQDFNVELIKTIFTKVDFIDFYSVTLKDKASESSMWLLQKY